jgi:hypothetical protein
MKNIRRLTGVLATGTLVTLMSSALHAAPATTGDSSFTPTSVVIPVTEITLRNGDSGGSQLYSCTGTLADCGVDITDATALAALAASSTIDAGTYDRIAVGTCRDEGSYDATISGSVNVDGVDYYTTTPATPGTSNVLSTVAADLGPVTVNYSGCVSEYLLSSPITVADGDSIVVNLFVNLENIAWARTRSASSIPSGCQNNGTDQVVCMAYPDVVAYIGAATPSVQTYHVSVQGSTNVTDGQFILLFNADGSTIGGFTRPYYGPASSGTSGFDTPLRTFSANGDGTYTLGNYGGSATSYERLITDFIPATTAGGIVSGVHDATSPTDAGKTYDATLQ